MHALNIHVLQHCHCTEELFMRLLLPGGVRGPGSGQPGAALGCHHGHDPRLSHNVGVCTLPKDGIS